MRVWIFIIHIVPTLYTLVVLLFSVTASDALRPVIMTMDPKQSPGLSAVVDDVWPLLCHTMGCQGLDRNVVLQASLHALEAIVEVRLQRRIIASCLD